MDNIIDFAAAKEQKEERQQGDIHQEIEWAEIELEKLDNFINELEEEIETAQEAKLEILTYHAGIVMAKNIVEGNYIELLGEKYVILDTSRFNKDADKIEIFLKDEEGTK